MDTSQRHRVGRRLVLIGVLVVLLASAALVLLAAGRASADGVPSAGWVPGDRCTAGSANRVRHGKTYGCVQKKWDDCPRWHEVKPAGYTPPADWTRPSQRPCKPACSPTPSPSTAKPTTPAPTTPAATTPAAVPHPTTPAATTPAATTPAPVPASPTTPAAVPAGTLPVTGSGSTLLLVLLGAVCVAAGTVLRFSRRVVRGSVE